MWKNGTGGRSTKGASTETPKALTGWGNGERVSLPTRVGCLGEHRKLPQWGPGQSPGKFWFLGYFLCQKHDVYAAILQNLSRFLNEKSAIAQKRDTERPGKRSTGTLDKQAEKRDVSAKTGRVATLGEWYPLHRPLKGLRKRRELPISGIWCGAQAGNAFFWIFAAKTRLIVTVLNTG